MLAFASATLATTSARADLSFPSAEPFVGSVPTAPVIATPSPITPPVSPPAGSQPIELREVFWGTRHGGVRHGPFPFQGNKPLDGADLYRALGRDDLVRSYESRAEAKMALWIGALGSLVIGAIVLNSATPDTECSTPPRYSLQPAVCRTDWKSGTVAAGIGLLALGPILAATAGLAIDSNPVSPAERQRLIDAFNSSLPRPTSDGAPARPKPAAIRFTTSPTVSGNGAGLRVDARF